ncbi:TetR/AcrR family transcriptional regulator [Paenibacillus thermotolerans]|uniref:TetR/AcrR family transcriptional regulator n=1 Tax=Paenibacillus thermotolerans TaxID=3027807 RepID=UPI0023687093|nr:MULTISPECIES: TetR/AcrR family transcriptional regulator [unclassified Paenibacillus]
MAPEQNEERWIEELLKLSDEQPKMTEKQNKILMAAIEVFSEKGYSASSTSEIAQRAGVAEGTIFRHYKTKKDLLFSIVSPIVAKFIAPFVFKDFFKVLNAPYPSFEQFLRAVFRNRDEFVRKNLSVIRILLQEIPFHPEMKEPFKEMIEKEIIPKVQGIVMRFQSQGFLRGDMPPLSALRLAVTTVLGFFIARYIIAPELAWDDEAEVDRTIEFILHGLAGPNEGGSSQ